MKEVITKSGIKLNIDERIVNDTRFLMYVTDMQSDEEMERIGAVFGLLELIIGSKKKLIEYQNSVADLHGGICDASILADELTSIMESIGAKK